jgi:hypothetical protein
MNYEAVGKMPGNRYPKIITWVTASVIFVTIIILVFLFYSVGTPAGQSHARISIAYDHPSTVISPELLTGSTPFGNTVRNIAPQAQAIQSSPTQSGQGVENVLPDHPDSTGLVFTGTPPYNFTLSLGYATAIHRIEIFWETNTSIADEYQVDDVDSVGRVFKRIAYKKNMSGDYHNFSVPDNQSSSFLKFSFRNTTSQTSPKITQVRIFADGPDQYQTIVMDSSSYNKLFLSQNDPENPLRIFRLPIRYSMVDLADRILAGESNLTDHQKIVKFMQLTYDYKIGTPRKNMPETIVREKIGSCGEFTNVLIALAATQKIPSRMIGLYNYPPNDGHVVTEFYYEGSWHVYDPTYGSYFVSTVTDPNSNKVLSFDEVKHATNGTTDLNHVVLNEKRYNQQYPRSADFSDLPIYQKADPSGKIGPETPLLWPLSLDLKEKPLLEVLPGTNPRNQGSGLIGAADTNNNHLWTLTSLIPGQDYRFIITPLYMGGDLPSDVFNASAQILHGGSIQKSSSGEHTFVSSRLEPWEIEFIAKNSTVQIQISHPYQDDFFHYIKIKKYELVPKT